MEQIREIRSNPVELRIASEDSEDRTIKGTAIVYNSRSELLTEKGIKFYEIIKPESISQELIDKSDIIMLYNHKKDMGVLARSKNGKGSLKIELTDKGVDFEFKAKKTSLGNEVLESVRQGDLDGCSFAFYITREGEKWEKEGDVRIRTINKIELLEDLSIVTSPAYSMTTVNSRSLDSIIEKETEDKRLAEEKRIADEKEAEEKRIADEKEANEKREIELNEYYQALEKRISNI